LNVKRIDAVFGSQGFTQKEFVMKRFWHTCLAVIASATMTAGVADAQNDWNVPSEIGSYQSILSRAGYGNGMSATSGSAVGGSGTNSMSGMLGGGTVNGGGVLNGGMVNGGGALNGGMVNGGGALNGGVVNGGMFNGGMVNGGMVNGGMVNGGMVTGEVVNGGSVSMPYNGSAASSMGQPMMTQPRMGQPVMTQPRMTAPMVTQPRMVAPMTSYDGGGGGYIDSGYGGMIDGGCGGSAYTGVVDSGMSYAAPAYSAPVFSSGGFTGAQLFNGGGRARSANWVVGLFALSFARDYEDDVLLSENPAGDQLFTTDADEGDFGGYGVNLTRRQCNGRGLELRYWAFNTGASAQLDGANVYSVMPTLIYLEHAPSARDLLSIYDTTEFHTIERETDINNLEVNLLNNGGFYQTRRGRSAAFELVGGFRWFQFDERLAYTTAGDVAVNPLATETFTYQSQVENNLVGFQLGARNELCLTNKLRGFFGVTAGIFNNNIQTRQNFFDANGEGATLTDGPSTGREYDFSDEKNDVAMIGELDMGVTYQLTQRARARFGYRTFGVAGVALAADQIPVDFRRTDRVQRANSNGSLLLHGGYAGMEFCF